MKIKGTVEDIIFRNAENGYCVVLLDCSLELVTAVGIFPPLVPGEMLELDGEFVENKRYGQQFNMTKLNVIRPTSNEAVFRYLSSGLFKGVGEMTAHLIVEKFGEDTLDVMENEPTKLSKIKGITLKKAMSLSETLKSLKEMQSVILYLQDYEINMNLSVKIYKTYESKTRTIIEKNPYQMIDDIEGIGFITADKIAVKLGFEKDSQFRISAAITYCLGEIAGKNGHTYLPKNELRDEVSKLLSFATDEFFERVDIAIDNNVVAGKVIILEKDGMPVVMKSSSFLTETLIAAKIVEMNKQSFEIMLDIDTEIKVYEQMNGIKLHSGQSDAVKNCISYGVNVITGGPGTGKTTIIKCIIQILKQKGLSVCLCAPTGRASKRLSEATGEDAKTIHRMLDLSYKEDGKGYFTYNENTRLEADVVIVDEVSMCDEYVFSSLIRSVKRGGRLIMVGDKDQLPSVGAGNVLADIIASQRVQVNYLTQIYRQGENSTIITNAHLINQGKMPVLDNKSRDFFFDNQGSQQVMLTNIVDMVTTRLPKFAGVTPKDIQVLCPMKRGIVGVENVNNVLQDALNPATDKHHQITVGMTNFRVNDKIIHIVNNYQMEWTNVSDNLAGTGVFNGDVGEIVAIDLQEPSLSVRFEDGRLAKYKQSEFDQIALAYAISIHKSQGAEFEVALVAIAGGNYIIMTKNLLYTAVTRAKKMVVIVGNDESLRKMVGNNYTAKRYSMLKDFIIEKSDLQEKNKEQNKDKSQEMSKAKSDLQEKNKEQNKDKSQEMSKEKSNEASICDDFEKLLTSS